MDLPLIGRANLRECGALCCRPEADERQRIAYRPAVAGEVDDGVSVRLPGVENEGVVAGISGEPVNASTAVDGVGADIAKVACTRFG